MIDDNRIAIMTERLDVAEEIYERMYSKYCEILDTLISIKQMINGNPQESLRLLKEMLFKIKEVQDSVTFEVNKMKPPVNKARLSWLAYSFIFIISIIGSFIGGLLLNLL